MYWTQETGDIVTDSDLVSKDWKGPGDVGDSLFVLFWS